VREAARSYFCESGDNCGKLLFGLPAVEKENRCAADNGTGCLSRGRRPPACGHGFHFFELAELTFELVRAGFSFALQRVAHPVESAS